MESHVQIEEPRDEPKRSDPSFTERLKIWAKSLKRQCVVLMFVMKHPQTPWLAKLIGGLTLLYALSPIDLIPDFIPVLGYLDDLLLVPIGIWLTVKLVPDSIWKECENQALEYEGKPAKDWRGVILVVIIWAAILIPILWWLYSSYYA